MNETMNTPLRQGDNLSHAPLPNSPMAVPPHSDSFATAMDNLQQSVVNSQAIDFDSITEVEFEDEETPELMAIAMPPLPAIPASRQFLPRLKILPDADFKTQITSWVRDWTANVGYGDGAIEECMNIISSIKVALDAKRITRFTDSNDRTSIMRAFTTFNRLHALSKIKNVKTHVSRDYGDNIVSPRNGYDACFGYHFAQRYTSLRGFMREKQYILRTATWLVNTKGFTYEELGF